MEKNSSSKSSALKKAWKAAKVALNEYSLYELFIGLQYTSESNKELLTLPENVAATNMSDIDSSLTTAISNSGNTSQEKQINCQQETPIENPVILSPEVNNGQSVNKGFLEKLPHLLYFSRIQEQVNNQKRTAFAKAVNMRKTDIFGYQVSATSERNGYVLCKDTYLSAVVLYINGTQGLSGLLHDLDSINTPFLDGYVHTGMLNCARWFDTNLKSIIQDFMKEWNFETLFLIGHSLGGGVASLLSMLWLETFSKMFCYCFATPAIVSKNLIQKTKNITTIVHQYDFVPYCSIASFKKLKEEIPPDWKNRFMKDTESDSTKDPVWLGLMKKMGLITYLRNKWTREEQEELQKRPTESNPEASDPAITGSSIIDSSSAHSTVDTVVDNIIPSNTNSSNNGDPSQVREQDFLLPNASAVNVKRKLPPVPVILRTNSAQNKLSKDQTSTSMQQQKQQQQQQQKQPQQTDLNIKTSSPNIEWLYPAGTIYHLKKNEASGEWTIFEVENENFDRLQLIGSFLSDHFMASYRKAIYDVERQCRRLMLLSDSGDTGRAGEKRSSSSRKDLKLPPIPKKLLEQLQHEDSFVKNVTPVENDDDTDDALQGDEILQKIDEAVELTSEQECTIVEAFQEDLQQKRKQLPPIPKK